MADDPQHAVPALQIAETLSQVQRSDEVLVRMDGVINLFTKAVAAVQRAEPGDRARALALIDRAERYLPDPDDVAEDHRDSIATMRDSVLGLRRDALALPEG